MRARTREGNALEAPYRVVWADRTVRHLLSGGRPLTGAITDAYRDLGGAGPRSRHRVGAQLLDAGRILTRGVPADTQRPLRDDPSCLTTVCFDDEVQDEGAELSADFPLPMVQVARTGQALHLPDSAVMPKVSGMPRMSAAPGGARQSAAHRRRSACRR